MIFFLCFMPHSVNALKFQCQCCANSSATAALLCQMDALLCASGVWVSRWLVTAATQV